MCGIVGYIGRRDASPIILEGWRRLEYRGYDSAGISALADGELLTRKRRGRIAEGLSRALAETRRRGHKVLAVCNVVGSTIAREADGGIYLHAGPEIGVASTKAFTSQVAVLALFPQFMGRLRMMSPARRAGHRPHPGPGRGWFCLSARGHRAPPTPGLPHRRPARVRRGQTPQPRQERHR